MIDTHLNLSEDILQNTDPKSSTHEDIQNNVDIIESLNSEIMSTLSMNETYEYFSYKEKEDSKMVEKLCGELVTEEISVTAWNCEELVQGSFQASSLTTPRSFVHSKSYSDLGVVGEEIATDFKCTGKHMGCIYFVLKIGLIQLKMFMISN